MGRIWSDQNKFQQWLEVELAASEALAERGVVPIEAARLAARARCVRCRPHQRNRRQVKHDVIAFTTAVSEDGRGGPRAAVPLAYDNLAAKDYPAILAMGGLTDPRVTYWEPAKWIARLRATMTGGGPVLLRTNMGAGHGGASGRFNRLDEVAIAYSFALWAVGLADRGEVIS